MWTCPYCNFEFKHNNQTHSCNERTIAEFLAGKSEHTLDLYHYFVNVYRSLGPVVLRPTKSMIGLCGVTRFASITQLGKNFIHVVLHLDRAYEDNLCFVKVGQVPGSNQFNHHLRIMSREDVNEEVRGFMRLAMENGTGDV